MRHRTHLAVATLIAALTVTAGAGAERSANWYWTPAACKSALTSGVQISDGRYFYPTLSFCVGTASTCAWNYPHTMRLYSSFYVIMRSADGVVRTMTLNVTGRATWSGTDLRVRYRYMDPARFAVYNRIIATAYAQQQNNYGCASGVLGP